MVRTYFGSSSVVLVCLNIVKTFFIDRISFWQVWNASNGHILNKLEPVEENEVTGIISLPEKSKIVTVGWNRKILVYYDDIQVRIPASFGVIVIVKLNPSLC